MEKKCTKCGEVKSLDEFSNAKKGKHGKAWKCKSCNKEYRLQNIERIKESQKLYHVNNKEEICERVKKWRKKNIDKRKTWELQYKIKNKEKINQYNKEYYENNKEKIIKKSKEYANKNIKKLEKYRKEYYENNKEKISKKSKEYNKLNKEKTAKRCKEWNIKNREKINKYRKLKNDTNPLFNLKNRIRGLIHISLKNKGYDKKTKTHNILKCEYDFFMQWINGIASNGNTYGVGDLHLDHVVPTSLATTEQEMIILNHYSNFQLLSADENRSKGNRCVNPTNLKRVLEHHPEPNKIKEIYSRL
jgi:hypothetical protein